MSALTYGPQTTCEFKCSQNHGKKWIDTVTTMQNKGAEFSGNCREVPFIGRFKKRVFGLVHSQEKTWPLKTGSCDIEGLLLLEV